MYLKITKKVTNWIYGLEYSHSKVGDIIYVSNQAEILIRADNLAEPVFEGAELDEYVAQLEQKRSMDSFGGFQITLTSPANTNNQKEFNV